MTAKIIQLRQAQITNCKKPEILRTKIETYLRSRGLTREMLLKGLNRRLRHFSLEPSNIDIRDNSRLINIIRFERTNPIIGSIRYNSTSIEIYTQENLYGEFAGEYLTSELLRYMVDNELFHKTTYRQSLVKKEVIKFPSGKI
jgi:hypothetical protein